MKNVLLIDDDADDRLLFCEAFEDVASDITCHVAVNGRVALNKLNSNELVLPDLIFLDVNMPLINGWQCLSIFKNDDKYKNIPVIMYSTSSFNEDIDRALQSGALCFFTKPSDYNELKNDLKIVAAHLANKTLQTLAGTSPAFAG